MHLLKIKTLFKRKGNAISYLTLSRNSLISLNIGLYHKCHLFYCFLKAMFQKNHTFQHDLDIFFLVCDLKSQASNTWGSHLLRALSGHKSATPQSRVFLKSSATELLLGRSGRLLFLEKWRAQPCGCWQWREALQIQWLTRELHGQKQVEEIALCSQSIALYSHSCATDGRSLRVLSLISLAELWMAGQEAHPCLFPSYHYALGVD